jgi:hypothetical protein
MIRPRATHSTRGHTVLLVALASAAFLGPSAGKAQAHWTSHAPAAAVTRLTSLGFSTRDARRLLLSTETHPSTAAGAYAAQRIAMAVLYGNADAFGGPRYRPASNLKRR